MQLFRYFFILSLTTALFLSVEGKIKNNKVPRLTVIIVVDQCAARFLYSRELASHYSLGLARLLKQGIVYYNAFFPHGKPETAVGHAALNTGTYAEYHGFIGNDWYENGVHIVCDEDKSERAKLLTEDAVSGKSAQYLMVDGISDQFVLANKKRNHVVSVSTKSRSAIGTAGHLGKPIWFDTESASFTSSRAYFDSLPEFLAKFNKKKNLKARQTILWNPCAQEKSDRFATVSPESYMFSRDPAGFFKNSKPIFGSQGKSGLFWYLCSPESMSDLFELGKETIKEYLTDAENSLLLWISIGAFDKLGHTFGPDSFEARDFLCHLDSELEQFIRFSQKAVGKGSFVCFFTADHGVTPLPEVLNQTGLPTKRILTDTISEQINATLEKEFGIKKPILNFLFPYIYLDQNAFSSIDTKQQFEIINKIKTLLLKEEGVKQVWTTAELAIKPVEPGSIESDFKHQLFKQRNGDLIVQSLPFYLFTDHKQGASHATPYTPDTHVPLICYAPRRFLPRAVYSLVSPLQVASTLATLLRIPFPSAAQKEILPGIFVMDRFLEAL
jgi:arylsulfatase A-like enzyme